MQEYLVRAAEVERTRRPRGLTKPPTGPLTTEDLEVSMSEADFVWRLKRPAGDSETQLTVQWLDEKPGCE